MSRIILSRYIKPELNTLKNRIKHDVLATWGPNVYTKPYSKSKTGKELLALERRYLSILEAKMKNNPTELQKMIKNLSENLSEKFEPFKKPLKKILDYIKEEPPTISR